MRQSCKQSSVTYNAEHQLVTLMIQQDFAGKMQLLIVFCDIAHSGACSAFDATLYASNLWHPAFGQGEGVGNRMLQHGGVIIVAV